MVPRTLSLIVCVALTSACIGREAAARRFIESGDAHLAAGRGAAAVIEYRNAIKTRPAWAEAYRKLGDAYMGQGESEEAYRAYSNAIEIDPADAHSQVEAGRLLFSAGRYNEALVKAEHALERDERSVDAQVLWGRVLGKMHRFDEAIAQLEKAVAVDHRPEVYNALGEVKFASGDRVGAEQAFRAAIASDAASVDARLALAQFLSAVGNTSDAEQELQRAASAHPTSELVNRTAAAFYLSLKRDADAEPYLRAAANLPNQKLKSTLALADFLIAAHRFRDAAMVLDAVTSGPMETAAKVRLAAIALETGSAADARRILDPALNRHATAEGLALNAQLLQIEGKADAALSAAHAAVELNPNIPAAQYVIGSIEMDRGHFDVAEQAFRAVLRENRLRRAASLQLARAKIAAGHPADAIPFAEAAGVDLNARLTLARALIAAGQTDRARTELTQLEAAHRTASEPAVLLGSIELAGGHIHEARAYADRALALAPGGVDALVLAARTALAARDVADAERFLERAVARDPSSFEAHGMLAQIYASRGDLARAQSTIETVVAKRPDVAAARTALGIVLEAANRPAEARARYEQALAINPAEPIAANNLARLYASDEARTTDAIDLARKAVAQMPNDADVYDTLGWIAFKAGRLTMARSALERAVALDPRDATSQGHLQSVRKAIDQEARVKAVEAAARAKLLPDESKEAR